MTKKEKENPIFRKTGIALAVTLMFSAGMAMAQSTVPADDDPSVIPPGSAAEFLGAKGSDGTYTAIAAPDEYWSIDATGLDAGVVAEGTRPVPGVHSYADGNLVLKRTPGGDDVIIQVLGSDQDGNGSTTSSVGLYVTGDLTVEEGGGLDSEGGTGRTARGTRVGGDLYVAGGTVAGQGGSNEHTQGILVHGDMIQTGGAVTAEGGGATAGAASGIAVEGTLSQSAGTIKATGGSDNDTAGMDIGWSIADPEDDGIVQTGSGKIEAIGSNDAGGAGLLLWHGNLAQNGEGTAEIKATGRAVTGLIIANGDLVQKEGNAGTIIAQGGTADGAHGIHIQGRNVGDPTDSRDGNLVQYDGKIEATGGTVAHAHGIMFGNPGDPGDPGDPERSIKGKLFQHGGEIDAKGGRHADAHGIALLGEAGEDTLVQKAGGKITATGGVGFAASGTGITITTGNLVQEAGGTIIATGGDRDDGEGIRITDGNLVTAGTITAKGTDASAIARGIDIVSGDLVQQGGRIDAIGGSTHASAVGIVLSDGNLRVEGTVHANYNPDTGVTNSAASGIVLEGTSATLVQEGVGSKIYAYGGKNATANGIALTGATATLTQTLGEIHAYGSNVPGASAHGISLAGASANLSQGATGVIVAQGGNADGAMGIWVGNNLTAAGDITAIGARGEYSQGIHIANGTLTQTGGTIKAEARAGYGASGIGIATGNLTQNTGGKIEATGGSNYGSGIYVAGTFTQDGATSFVKAEGGSNNSHGLFVGGEFTQTNGEIKAYGGGAHSSGIAILSGNLVQTVGKITATAGNGANAHGIRVEAGNLVQNGNRFTSWIDAKGGATTQHGIDVGGDATINGRLDVSTAGTAYGLNVAGNLEVNAGAAIGIDLVNSSQDRPLINVGGDATVVAGVFVDITDFDNDKGDVRTIIAVGPEGELVLPGELSDINFMVGGVENSIVKMSVVDDGPDDRFQVRYDGIDWNPGNNIFDVDTRLTVRENLEDKQGEPISSLEKTGEGVLTLMGTNTYTGGTKIDSGTLSLSRNDNIGPAATGRENFITTGAVLQLTGEGPFTHAWTLDPNGTGATIEVAPGITATVSGVLSQGNLTKDGEGVLELGADNQHRNTTITDGVLSIGGDINLGSGDNTIRRREVGPNGEPGADAAVLRLTGAEYSRPWTLDGDIATIEVLTGSAATMGGVLSGSARLEKDGEGTLQLTGTNTYTGGTLISAGTLSIETQRNIGGVSAGAITIEDATLQLTRAGESFTPNVFLLGETAWIEVDTGKVTLEGGLTGGVDTTFVKDGSGELVLEGTSQLAGDIYVLEGDLDIAGGLGEFDGVRGAWVYSGHLQTGEGSTLYLSAEANQIFAGDNTVIIEDTLVARRGFDRILAGPGTNVIGTAYVIEGASLIIDRNAVTPNTTGRTHIDNVFMRATSTLAVESPLTIGKVLGIDHAVDPEVQNPTLGASFLHISDPETLNLSGVDLTFKLYDGSPAKAETENGVLILSGDGTLDLRGVMLSVEGLDRDEVDGIPLINTGLVDVLGLEDVFSLGSRIEGTQLVEDVNLFVYDDGMVYVLADGRQATRQAQTLSEGYVTGVALVNQGADVVAGLAMSNAVEAATTGANAFAAVQGGRNNYDVGSKSKLDSVAFLLGAANGWAVSDSNRMTVGGFIEYGTGSYDTEHSFADGKGHSYYYGLGALGRLDIGTGGANKAYVEGSFRLGQVKNRNDALLGEGTVSYDASSMYYGLHVGGGYVMNLSEKSSLDLYGKYLWTRVASETADLKNDDADNVHFSGVNSHRTRLGGRYIYQATSAASVYGGLAWEHEFDAKSKSSVNYLGSNYGAGVPDLKGSSALLEAGVRFSPSDSVPLYIDLGLTGYVGKRDGIMGNLRVNYRF